MSDFEKKITEAVEKKLNHGTVEKLVEKKLEEAVTAVLGDLFSYNGEGKKMLESKFKEIIPPIIEHHDFNQYLIKMDTILSEIINRTALEDNKKILENFKHLMKEPDKKNVSLSEIFEKYRDYVAENVDTSNLEALCDDGEPYYENVTALMRVDNKSPLLTYERCIAIFSCDQDENLNFEVNLIKRKGKEEWDIDTPIVPVDICSLSILNDFEIYLLTLQRSYTKIDIDTEEEYDDEIEPNEKPEWSLN